MALKKVKPTSPGRRFQTYADFDEVSKKAPEKGLLQPLSKSGGRNCYGRVTAWQRGGGHKRHYRVIDFKRDKIGVPARVAAIEYDPNRSARIALLTYADGEKRYILQPLGLKVGDTIVAGDNVDIESPPVDLKSDVRIKDSVAQADKDKIGKVQVGSIQNSTASSPVKPGFAISAGWKYHSHTTRVRSTASGHSVCAIT